MNRAETRYDSIAVAIEAPVFICMGTPLPMRLVLRNTAGRPITLTYVYTFFTAYFEVQDDAGRHLWDSDSVPLVPTSQVLAAGDSLEHRLSWHLSSARAAPIGPGSYRVLGRAMLEGKSWPGTPPVTFTIESR